MLYPLWGPKARRFSVAFVIAVVGILQVGSVWALPSLAAIADGNWT
jgi:hypothetical protein